MQMASRALMHHQPPFLCSYFCIFHAGHSDCSRGKHPEAISQSIILRIHTPGGKMAKYLPVFCSLLFFILIHWALSSDQARIHQILYSATIFNYVLVSGRRNWWPPHGTVKVKCPYKKVDLSWFTGTANPCPDLYQPICGTNFVTYENPCIFCIESMKSHGKIRFQNDGKC
ncbi:serine protease inhibitor Kazal-type 14 isoform X2 [Canis lupus baileyi]|uniref:serine protease inhibitor Kazal-type 14 isoform X2 n=1 Tax=Canis lupus dingo TaxID=286419 RepID=UPI0015F1A75C|nr:serine protease inhibitor Kazal-type 14 isoform X2 [Canis lupus dingo]XP_038385549.1 serine protease inhibitor Kazal-type 14 isoform X2 [Canis lupus familiaris]XP_038513865.1 serine protease inhibitor Kazal-type 14 isoform X2 [Canis lupus familiaris]